MDGPRGSVEGEEDIDQEQLACFNRDLIRDNEKMLEEIDDLRDENDELRDGMDKLKREVIIQRRFINELENAREGQSDAWLRLQQEVEKEEAITTQLQTVFDTLSSHRFDNLFIRLASERHAALGGERALSKLENRDIAKTALMESERQLDNVQGIVESMVNIPNFQTNPKDTLILEAITQIISLSRVMNQTVLPKCTPTPTPAVSLAPPPRADANKSRRRSPLRRFFTFGKKKKEAEAAAAAKLEAENKGGAKRTVSNANSVASSSGGAAPQQQPGEGAKTAQTSEHFDLCEGVLPEVDDDDIETLVKGLITARRPRAQTTSSLPHSSPNSQQLPLTDSSTACLSSTQNSARCNPSLSPNPAHPSHSSAHPTHPHSMYLSGDDLLSNSVSGSSATAAASPTIHLPFDRREQPLTARGVAGRADLLQSLSNAFQTTGDLTARRMAEQQQRQEQQQLSATMPKGGNVAHQHNHHHHHHRAPSPKDPNAQTYS